MRFVSLSAPTCARFRLALGFAGLAALLTGCASVRPPPRQPPVERTLLTTGYCACGQCCGWHRNWLGRPVYSTGARHGQRKAVGITASGTRACKGTIAADTSRYPFGTLMHVDGYGYGRVEDVGGAIKGDHIDLYFDRHAEALQWGRRTKRVKVWFP